MPTLEQTLTRTNDVLAALEGLIAGDAARTPIPDSSVSYSIPTPTYNEANDEWTLTQTTADTDGLYKGLYQLAISTGCSVITIISHNIVTPDDGIPARYAPCGGSLTNVGSVSALNNLEINRLEFRSKNPFTVTITLGMNWCYKWDFATSQNTWTKNVGIHPYTEAGETGFGSTTPNPCIIEIQKAINGYIAQLHLHFFGVGSGGNTLKVYNGATLIYDSTFASVVNINANVTTLKIRSQRGFAYGLGWVEIEGIGANPFGTDNCV